MEIIFSLEEIQEVSKEVLTYIQHKIVIFNAPMGAGKTTLIKAIAKELGVLDMTNSPTFSIVNEYRSKLTGNKIYHLDLYRLNNEEEAYDMGMDEYLYSGEWCFIEWPDKTPTLIPEQHALIELEILSDDRRKLILINN
ncbi:tRNA (adenosine(37)-N6)-threonylcarbamoyltransferase complex ATPase subunit type 1 TsaE [Myroides indicus]|uniref:tRNA threonylcarbamoyladenosine biosynthesis protein TsaE n=1 Tax=Myroides indicus TaxID=1323422 RepID=A0A4R7FAN2_9FLAO|nr:tRNA (adenosine(37)-N6)-threonylcarbamoyltransferase complex ATPase subunit type 1 TsaE [Myroides indicus]TDS64169.1 tRNA threonylcarbamoyladenosine biosynthesis protein TsaE [Myroides indicus]